MTAFLLQLPDMPAQTYEALARPAAIAPKGSDLAALSGQAADVPAPLASCARCHGVDGAGRASGAFPNLGGQTEAYLCRALSDYAEGARPSGIMQPVASALKAQEIAALAAYFAGAASAPRPAPSADPTTVEIGRRIATNGGGARVAACAACHGLEAGPAKPDYPSLAGQYPGYIADQLRLFRDGKRGRTAHAAIMAAAIRGITEDEIVAAAAFYGRLAPARL